MNLLQVWKQLDLEVTLSCISYAYSKMIHTF